MDFTDAVNNHSRQSAMQSPRSVIVLVAYQSDRWLPDCLRTLASDWNSRDRLLVVDNSGNSQLEQTVRAIPESVVIATPRTMGFAEANNFALLHGGLDGDYVCLLNQDTLSGPRWIDNCIAEMERHPELGAVSPVLTTYDGLALDPGFAQCAGASPDWVRDFRNNALSDLYEVQYATAAALIVPTPVLRRVGPFDPIFGSYYEDYDLCRRIREHGFGIGICGQSQVRHFGGSTTTTKAAADRRARQVLRNRAIHRIRESGSRRMRALARILSSVPRNLLRGIVRTSSSQPVRVQLAAYGDLLRLAPRISSVDRDHSRWATYLQEIGWPAKLADGMAASDSGHQN